ncbi:MAG: NUDIX hydrolase [Hyphomicrobium sp.]|uniref:NUDIX hydrolase n=1 Tax=Hyphomicrobium sp. TaxID=82 RepID=UPI00132C4E59|nr:NUDIX hydrolase [Hyphomicrobium sp.]KAB2938589.1 MAG: NUDIX hydrolase [Hyphomicrobium sp.]MBZ0211743.1 NUDIX hydrolase [Hyphomicrobium sp.]
MRGFDTAERPQGPWPRAGASAVLFRGSTVLLVERGEAPAQGLWSLPGGSIEAGEPAEDTARREVREEAGLEAHIVGLAGVYDIIEHESDGTVLLHYVLATYFGRAAEGDPRAGGDARDARFFPLDALEDLPMTPGTRFVIAEAWRLLAAGGD